MKKRPIKRGDVYYAELPAEEVGSVQAGSRPVLVTQSNWLNRRSTTVIVAMVTSQIKRLDLATHVLLPIIKGLPKQSMVMTEQRKTISKDKLVQYRCTLDPETMKKVTRALKESERDDSRENVYGRRR